MTNDRKDQTSQTRTKMEPGTRIRQQKKKVLLMGKSGAGKSSMRSIIFSNHVARDVRRLQATIDVDKKRVKFLGNLVLDIWDCGGQDAFTESYLTPAQRPYMFSDVGVLIYVFDIESSDFAAQGTPANTDRDLQIYAAVIKALAEFSPRARIFVMIHKMDVVKNEERESVLDSKSFEIVRRSGIFKRNVGIYGTSIWDETLYRAWGSIVNSLIPNLDVIEYGLKDLKIATEAEEIVLFEQNTFLTITRMGSQVGDRNPNRDRFEKISHVIKTFKHSLGTYTESNSSHQLDSFNIKTKMFNLIINRLTYNTYVLIVFPPGEAELQCARLNVLAAKEAFANIKAVADGDDDSPQMGRSN